MNENSGPRAAPTDVGRFFIAGGTLSPGVPSYISRQADEDLYEGLTEGEFCYVLTSRQMGKSSLMVRTAARLRDAGSTVAMLDVTSVGQQVTPEQWYDGLAMGLGQALDMEDELEDFWLDHERLSPVQRWVETIRAAVLPNIDGRLVIFVDEVDTVRSLPFPTDEFFAAIRACHNRRAQAPEFERLTFCLLGVSTPTDLIRNPQTTPFNIGRRIDLADFTEDDIGALAPGMAHLGASAERVLSRVRYWTGGHPYLTQRLCEAVAKDEAATGPSDVDRLCDDLYLSRRAREQDTNLTFARDRVLRGGAMEGLDRASVLTLYGHALGRKDAPADDANPVASLLKIAGLVRVDEGDLRVRNRVYERVFDRSWIRENMPDGELRRQRVAYLKGVARTAAIAAAVVAVVTAFLVHSVRQERRVQTLLTQSRELLAQSRTERGMRLLEEGDSSGLLHLVHAAETVDAAGEGSLEIASLWAAWEGEHARRLQFVGGHDGGVTDLAYTPDSRHVVTTSYDGAARMWDVPTGALVGESERYEGATRSVAISPDGQIIAIGRSDGRVDLLRAEPRDGKLPVIASLEHAAMVYGADFSPDGRLLAASTAGGRVRLWDTATWEPFGQALVVPARGDDVVFRGDSAALAASNGDNMVRVWDVASGGLLAPPIANAWDGYQRLAFAPGENVVTARPDMNTVQMWDIDLGQRVGPAFQEETYIHATAFSPDGSLFATGTVGGVVRIYDRATGEERLRLPRHLGAVFALSFAPDGASIASGSMDGSVRVASLDDEAEQPPLWQPGTLTHTTFDREASRMVTTSAEAHAQLWDVDARAPIGGPLQHGSPCWAAPTPDGALVVTISTGHGIKVWQAESGRLLSVADAPAGVGQVGRPWFLADGRLVVRWGRPRRVEIWDVAGGLARVAPFRAASSVMSLASSPDGSQIAVGEYANVASVWDIASSSRLAPSFRHGRTVDAVAFSWDGAVLATGSRDQWVSLWNVDAGTRIGPGMHHAAGVSAVAFHPSGAMLATGTTDGVLRRWDVASQRQIGEPRRHGSGWFSASFAPGGGWLVTHSAASSVALWHVASGRLYPLPMRHGEAALVDEPAFSSDGRRLVAAFHDGQIRHWDMPEAPATAREMQLRTWVGLAARMSDQGVVEPIPWEEWRRLRAELEALRASGLLPSS